MLVKTKSNEDVKHIVLQSASNKQAIVEGIAIRRLAAVIEHDTEFCRRTFFENTVLGK